MKFQTDLTGRSLKEFVYPADYEDFTKCNDDDGGDGVTLSIRMKSVISPRGRNLNLKSALYKVRIIFFSCAKKTDYWN